MEIFKKYKIVEDEQHCCYNIMKRESIFSKWKNIKFCQNKHQAESILFRLETKQEPFKYSCSIQPKDKNKVLSELLKMGYTQGCAFDLHQKYIFTTSGGYIYTTDFKISKGDTVYGIFCMDRDDIFLALAAINDRNDYMQWFHFETYDCDGEKCSREQFLCDKENIVDFLAERNLSNIYDKMEIEKIVKLFPIKSKI